MILQKEQSQRSRNKYHDIAGSVKKSVAITSAIEQLKTKQENFSKVSAHIRSTTASKEIRAERAGAKIPMPLLQKQW